MTAERTAVTPVSRRRTVSRRTVMDDVLEMYARHAESGEPLPSHSGSCLRCGAQTRTYIRRARDRREELDAMGALNAMDQYMRDRPGDEFVADVICPCCSFEGCPDRIKRWRGPRSTPDLASAHDLTDVATLLGGLVIRKALALPMVAHTTTPDHPAFQSMWPGGPVARVASDAMCAFGNVYDADGHIVGYVEQGSCGRPQCQPSAFACGGDPDECWSGCRSCFPSALVAPALTSPDVRAPGREQPPLGGRRMTAERTAVTPVSRLAGEETCSRCGGPNVLCWHAPSPLWNAVMRDPETQRDRYGVVCPRCFAELAREAGVVVGRANADWCWRPQGMDVKSLWAMSDGRVWDDTTCLWVEPSAAVTPVSRLAAVSHFCSACGTAQEHATWTVQTDPTIAADLADAPILREALLDVWAALPWNLRELLRGETITTVQSLLPTADEVRGILRDSEPTP